MDVIGGSEVVGYGIDISIYCVFVVGVKVVLGGVVCECLFKSFC